MRPVSGRSRWAKQPIGPVPGRPARVGILDRGISNRMGLANVFQGMAGQALGGTTAAATGLAGIEQNLRATETARYGIDKSFEASKYSADRQYQAARKGANAQKSSGMWSGIGSVVGGLFGLFSDRRLKDNIEKIDKLPNGLTVYEFNYIDDPDTRYTGLMADEVFMVMPEHVGARDGYLTVNYAGVFNDVMEGLAA